MVSVLSVFFATGCCLSGRSSKEEPAPVSTASSTTTKTTPTASVTSTAVTTVEKPAPSATPAAACPIADGKYEHITVDGKSVAMIQVANNCDTVMVDVDGAKPRTWEEEYKRKGDLPPGSYNLHKTDVNKNNSFADDAVDKQGKWQIDSKGNIK